MGAATTRPSERRQNQSGGFWKQTPQPSYVKKPESEPVKIDGYGDREFDVSNMSWRRPTRHQDGTVRSRGGLVAVTDNGQQRVIGKIEGVDQNGNPFVEYELLRPHPSWDAKLGGEEIANNNDVIIDRARKDAAQAKMDQFNKEKLGILKADSSVNNYEKLTNAQLSELDARSKAWDAYVQRDLRAQEANNANIVAVNSQNIQIAQDNRLAYEGQERLRLDAIRTADQRRADSRNTLFQILALQNSNGMQQQQMKLGLLGDLMKVFGG